MLAALGYLSMSNFPPRHPISRVRLFLKEASKCTVTQKDEFEAKLEAAIIFGRNVIHHLQTKYSKHPDWVEWFAALRGNEAVEFFKEHRDVTLKEASPKIGQIIGFVPAQSASELYFFEPNVQAIDTVQKHLDEMIRLTNEASKLFQPKDS